MARLFTQVLTAIPSAPDTRHARDIAKSLGVSRDDVSNAAVRLRRRGLVIAPSPCDYQRTKAGDALVAAGIVIKRGPMRPGIDAAEEKRRVRPPRKDMLEMTGTLRERAWSALRILGKATIPEILELAATGETSRDPAGNVGRYLNQLARFGVVLRLDRRAAGTAETSNGHIRFSLVNNLGPKAPLYQREPDRLIDRNSGEALSAPPMMRTTVSRKRAR